jgi:hypothetical protein
MGRTRRLLETVAIAAAIGTCIGLSNPAVAQSASTPPGGSVILPAPEPPFGGVIGRKATESKPNFPQAVTAPKGAPNVLLILTDDVGFGAPTSKFPKAAATALLLPRAGGSAAGGCWCSTANRCLLMPSRTRTATSIPTRRSTSSVLRELIRYQRANTPSVSTSPTTAAASAGPELERLRSMVRRSVRVAST